MMIIVNQESRNRRDKIRSVVENTLWVCASLCLLPIVAAQTLTPIEATSSTEATQDLWTPPAQIEPMKTNFPMIPHEAESETTRLWTQTPVWSQQKISALELHHPVATQADTPRLPRKSAVPFFETLASR